MKQCISPVCKRRFVPAKRSQKYCAPSCLKHAWYLKNTPNKTHYDIDPKFWETQTGTGFYWEAQGAKLLNATHRKFSKGCDLLWGNKLVDVKSCNFYKQWWVFNRNKVKPCDFFLCYCLEDNKVTKILLIPEREFPLTGCSVGRKSKYDKFTYSPAA